MCDDCTLLSRDVGAPISGTSFPTELNGTVHTQGLYSVISFNELLISFKTSTTSLYCRKKI